MTKPTLESLAATHGKANVAKALAKWMENLRDHEPRDFRKKPKKELPKPKRLL